MTETQRKTQIATAIKQNRMKRKKMHKTCSKKKQHNILFFHKRLSIFSRIPFTQHSLSSLKCVCVIFMFPAKRNGFENKKKMPIYDKHRGKANSRMQNNKQTKKTTLQSQFKSHKIRNWRESAHIKFSYRNSQSAFVTMQTIYQAHSNGSADLAHFVF